MAKSAWPKIAIRIVAVLLIVWLIFVSLVAWAMRQPPEKFGRVMSYMPGPVVFLLAPFETMWMRARAGHLQPGDPAPDFNLLKLDKSDRIRLSSFHQPIVLIFGSYT